jgi:uncharacterized protein
MQTPATLNAPGDRIAVVDVLRAFSLFGIVITHSVTGFLAGQPPSPDFMLFSPFDRVVGQLEHLLTFGKFFTIFSFLFGLSFAIQLRNATQKGVGFTGRFSWRLVVLALIALVHGAFFTGDILIVYALLGLLLIPFRKLQTRTLLIIGLLLVFNVPGLLLGIAQVNATPTPEQLARNAELGAQFMQAGQRHFELKQSGPLADLVAMNLGFGLLIKMGFMVFTGRLWMTFGLFLLGMCAGRLEIFRDTEAHRRFFLRLLWSGGAVALVTTVIEIVHPTGMQPAQSAGDLLGSYSFTVQQISLSAFYVAAVTLLYWRRPANGILPALAPLGRMGLTTYLGQSAFGVLVFYGLGLGLLGKIGVAAAVGLAIAFYGLQVLLARAWMAKFTLGPVEWLWRSLTYFRLQPTLRSATPAAPLPPAP